MNLTALLLRDCLDLMYVPPLANLRTLKRLDLNSTAIAELPQGIEMLRKLTYLDINHSDVEKINFEVIPKLLNLQDLALCCHSGSELELEKRVKVRGEELASLTKLENLEGELYDINHFNACIRLLKEGTRLTNYILQLGNDQLGYGNVPDFEYKKVVILTKSELSCESCIQGDYPILLPKDVELLKICSCIFNMVGTLSNIMPLKNTKNLKASSVCDCDGLKFLASSSSAPPLFQIMESLILERLWDFNDLIESVQRISPS